MKRPICKTFLALVLGTALPMSFTLAYLTSASRVTANHFDPARVTTGIEEPAAGTAAEKTALVANHNESPVYVRAVAVVSGGDAEVLPENFTFAYNTGHWQDGGDGYHYYRAVLPGREGAAAEEPKTEPLFTGVLIDPAVPQDARFSLCVYQESVLALKEEWTLEEAKAAFAAKG